jgi:monoamine oxidase
MADPTAQQAPTKKSPTKSSSGKKATAKKTSAKKAPAKKTTKKAAGKRAGSKKTSAARSSTTSTGTDSSPRESESAHRSNAAPRAEAPPARRSGGSQVAALAREAVLELTGKVGEAVTGLERTDDGWTVEVDVLELERIPSTTDVLATYRVTLDDEGELQGCRRVHRYLRGSPGDE